MGPNTARLDTIEIRDFWLAQESGDKGGRWMPKQKTGELLRQRVKRPAAREEKRPCANIRDVQVKTPYGSPSSTSEWRHLSRGHQGCRDKRGRLAGALLLGAVPRDAEDIAWWP